MKRFFHIGLGWGIFLFCLTVTGCATKTITAPPPRTLAVFDLADYSASGEEGPPSEMGEILTSRLIQALQEIPSVTVVEREKLSLALEELNIGSSALAESETRLRVGQILGARHMVFGGYQVFGGMMRLDIRLVDVETGKIIKAVDESASASDMGAWLKTVDTMGKTLLE